MRQCSHCDKLFTRQCDRAKHEKTHRRPHKCPYKTCKYHEHGWPTEKELSRHLNDKHNANPEMFECLFKPCPYKSKRQSNCKQHMEKAHGWLYQRSKNASGAQQSRKPQSGPESPGAVDMLTPVSNEPYSALTPPPESLPNAFGPVVTDRFGYPSYPTDQEFLESRGHVPLSAEEIEADIAALHRRASGSHGGDFAPYGSTFHDSDGFVVRDELYAATAHIPSPPLMIPGHPLTMDDKLTTLDFLSQIIPSIMPSLPMAPQVLPMQHGAEQSKYPGDSPHRSPLTPGAESDAMLYTPSSLGEVDECFDEVYMPQRYKSETCSSSPEPIRRDFVLFPPNLKPSTSNLMLFNAQVPSAGLSFSSQNDMYPSQPMEVIPQPDWPSRSIDFPSYHPN